MNKTFNNDILSARAGVLAFAYQGAANGLSGLFSRIRARREQRRVTEQLSALSDRELDDIGLTRGDVQDIGSFADMNPLSLLVRRPQ